MLVPKMGNANELNAKGVDIPPGNVSQGKSKQPSQPQTESNLPLLPEKPSTDDTDAVYLTQEEKK